MSFSRGVNYESFRILDLTGSVENDAALFRDFGILPPSLFLSPFGVEISNKRSGKGNDGISTSEGE